MSVPNCHICTASQTESGEPDLLTGDYCPVCHRPACRKHLATVRFRWRDSRAVDSALICADCKRNYNYRYWDSALRDWIS